MNKIKMLSVAAAMVLATTSLSAFEAKKDGAIYTMNGATIVDANLSGAKASAAFDLNATGFGDALIYPAFKSDEGWNTKISVKNDANTAVVAKVVLYSKENSKELRDFNIYLSAKDTFSFTIAGNEITTRDGSYIKEAKQPVTNSDGNTSKADISKIKTVDHENEDYGILGALNQQLSADEQAGYVVIYGMTQADNDYHGKHAALFNDYRMLVDQTRPGWAADYANGKMKNGLYTSNMSAPYVDGDVVVDSSMNLSAENNVTFSTVGNVLTGTVTLSKDDGINSRDMVLPATALSGYTEATKMMTWTEGEMAAIADRCIDGATGNAKYDAACLLADTKVFEKTSTSMSYNKASAVSNVLMVTQPTKRTVQQMDNLSAATKVTYWTDATINDKNITTAFGYFTTEEYVYDDKEGKYTPSTSNGVIISPASPDAAKSSVHSDEVAALDFLTHGENEGALTQAESIAVNGGYVDVTFKNNLPAIVTQMAGSFKDNGTDAQTNWYYAPTK